MAWRMRLAAIVAACLCILPTAAHCQTPFEARVLAALNFARTNPRAYAQALRTTRGYFHEAVYSAPGSDEDVITEEGVGCVDEAIAFLGRQAPLPPVAAAFVLDRSAAMLAADQGQTGRVGHHSDDGATPGERARRVGGGDFVAEVIAYGHSDPDDAVRQLIIDDGVADRGHRGVLFSPELRFVGISCGPHRSFRTICVVDLATTADGRFGSPRRFAPPPRLARADMALVRRRE